MRISVKARPNSKEEGVEKVGAEEFIVSVKEPPFKGMANNAIVRVLAEYFGVARSMVRIVSGYTSRQKIIEILGK